MRASQSIGSWLPGSWLNVDVKFFFAMFALVKQIFHQRAIPYREQLALALRAAIPTISYHVALPMFSIIVGFGLVFKAAGGFLRARRDVNDNFEPEKEMALCTFPGMRYFKYRYDA